MASRSMDQPLAERQQGSGMSPCKHKDLGSTNHQNEPGSRLHPRVLARRLREGFGSPVHTVGGSRNDVFHPKTCIWRKTQALAGLTGSGVSSSSKVTEGFHGRQSR